MDILEYEVPARWHREFTVQGFCPVDQDKPKDKKFPKSENAGKHKADMPTKPEGKRKFTAVCMDTTRLMIPRTVLNLSGVQSAQNKAKKYRGGQGDLQGP
eukprot:8404645-Ditylum_brightwellii.AAC.1